MAFFSEIDIPRYDMTARLFLAFAWLLLPLTALGQASVSGRVTDLKTGAPLEGIHVDLRTAENTRALDYREAWTGPDGRYILETVPPGQWRIRATLIPNAAEELTLATPTLGIVRTPQIIHFAFPMQATRPPGAGLQLRESGGSVQEDSVALSGRVRNALTRKALPEASVRLLVQEETGTDGGRYRTERKATTDAMGLFELPPVPPGRYLAFITQTGYDTLRTILNFNTPQTLDITLLPAERPPDPPAVQGRVEDGWGRILPNTLFFWGVRTHGTLTGLVTDGNGPAAGAVLSLLDTDFEVETNAEGRFSVNRIDPGHYRLRIIHGSKSVDLPPLEILAGPNEVNFNLSEQ